MVPPDRADAVLRRDGSGQRARHIALLRRITDKDIGYGRRSRWREAGTLHGVVVIERRSVVVNLRDQNERSESHAVGAPRLIDARCMTGRAVLL
jgi:hypothetical protein